MHQHLRKTVIRQCDANDFEVIHAIINDAAQAYKGVVSTECWKEPYMSRRELQHEVDESVVFWVMRRTVNSLV